MLSKQCHWDCDQNVYTQCLKIKMVLKCDSIEIMVLYIFTDVCLQRFHRIFTRVFSYSRVVCEWNSFGTNRLFSFYTIKHGQHTVSAYICECIAVFHTIKINVWYVSVCVDSAVIAHKKEISTCVSPSLSGTMEVAEMHKSYRQLPLT